VTRLLGYECDRGVEVADQIFRLGVGEKACIAVAPTFTVPPRAMPDPAQRQIPFFARRRATSLM